MKRKPTVKPKQPVHTRKTRADGPQIPPARTRAKAPAKAASKPKPEKARKAVSKVSSSVKKVKTKAKAVKRKEPRDPGRKCAYSAALRDLICEKVAHGEKWRDLEKAGICTQYQMSTWLRTIPEFAEHYARAREARAEWIVAEIQNELDGLTGESTYIDQNNAKMRIETHKWMVSCYYPRMYGTKVQVDATVTATNAVQYDYSRLSIGEAKTFRALMEKCRVADDST